MARVLLVEDDPILCETLSELLEMHGYDVSLSISANAALEMTYEHSYEIMLFDVNIPDFSGFELLGILRDAGDTTPCIFLTSLNDIASLSRGFELGADDYVKKPFEFDELLVRMQSIIRKSFSAKENSVPYKNLVYKIATNELHDEKGLIHLAPQEQKLLALFFKRIDETISKDDLLYELDSLKESSEGALRVYMSKLRKIGLEIQTIKGIGYRLVKA